MDNPHWLSPTLESLLRYRALQCYCGGGREKLGLGKRELIQKQHQIWDHILGETILGDVVA